MKTLADQIKDLENTRAVKVARMQEITDKSVNGGRGFEADEAEEFDDLESEIKQIDEDHARYSRMLKMQAATAVPVDHEGKVKSTEAGIKSAGPTIITRKSDPDDKFQGQSFTRKIIARAVAKMEDRPAWSVAEERWGKTHPQLVQIMKTDIPGGGSGSGEWGSELASTDNRYMGDFIQFLYAQTIYNQLPLREVPAYVTIKGQDGAATGYWVGESKAIPMSKADFNDVSLTPLKVAALSVISKELMRDSSPSAEMLVRDALVQACAQRIDGTFISNSAAVAGSTPAGILNNIAATTSAGTDGDAVLNDIKELRYRFITARNTGGLYFVMNPALASSLSLLRNALDQREFPNLTEAGGTLEGAPVVVGDNVNASHLILLKPSDIYRIAPGALEVSVSEHATIEMADNPAGASDVPADQSQGIVGMFQTESMAIKVVQPINFARRRDSAVAWISDADYGGAIST